MASTVNSPYQIDVQESQNRVDGDVLPNAHVTVVLRDSGGTQKTRFETNADGNGSFGTTLDADIVPSDRVEIDTEGAATIVIPVMRIDGTVNPVTDRIAGKVSDVSYPAKVVGEVWTAGGPQIEGHTDGAGNYNLSFAPFDLRNGHKVALWYVRPDGHRVGIVRQALYVQVNPADDRLSGTTAPDTAVNVTLRDSANNVKGTASVTSSSGGNWSTDITSGGVRVEINDHDTVQVTAGAYTANVVVPRITMLPDAPHDRLEIYSELPDTGLEISWDSTPGQANHDQANQDRVTTDGAGHAALDFGPRGGLALGVAGNLAYFNADGQCIKPWWLAMIDAVLPTTMINTADHTLTISGVGFKSTPTIYLGHNGVPLVQLTNVTRASDLLLQATVPAGTPAGVYELHVYNPDERIGFLADALTVSKPTPTVTAIAPNAGYFDETVNFTVTGSNFVAGAQVLLIDGTHVLTATGVTVISATQITGALDLHGAAAGQYDVVVKSAGPGDPSGKLAGGFHVRPRWRIRLPLILKSRA